jgi:hypothetical protein
VESAFYKLSDPVKQIESMVYNVVLGHVPKMNLDDAFLNQADIASDLRDNLDGSMKEYGYSVVKVLISDIVPDTKVKAAMNDINAAQREREATVSRAETNKLLLVKQAEAEAESKRLQGEGIANQRRAIISGLKDSVEDFCQNRPRFDAAGRDAIGADDAVLRHPKGNRGQRSQQHHLDPAHPEHPHRSFQPDSQRHRNRRGNRQAFGNRRNSARARLAAPPISDSKACYVRAFALRFNGLTLFIFSGFYKRGCQEETPPHRRGRGISLHPAPFDSGAIIICKSGCDPSGLEIPPTGPAFNPSRLRHASSVVGNHGSI